MLAHFFPSRCRSTERLDGKTVVVTGCNTGIGKYNAMDFCRRGAKVIMACRDTEKAEKARAEIAEQLGGEANAGSLEVKRLDLSSLASVRACAEEILAEEGRVDVLVNNAGVMVCPFGLTEDGVERHFATNHLGHFLLTMLLLPRMIRSAPSRIVNLSSSAHKWADLNLDDLNYERSRYNPRRAYGRSKLANILFTKELARRLGGTGVTAYAVHPGVVKTDIGRHLDESYFRGMSAMVGAVSGFLMLTPEQGAQTTVHCSVDKEAGKESGFFYSDCKVAKPAKEAEDPQLAEKLWNISWDLAKLGDYDPFATDDSPKSSKP